MTLEAYELTDQKRFLDEARAAIDAAIGLGFNINWSGHARQNPVSHPYLKMPPHSEVAGWKLQQALDQLRVYHAVAPVGA